MVLKYEEKSWKMKEILFQNHLYFHITAKEKHLHYHPCYKNKMAEQENKI